MTRKQWKRLANKCAKRYSEGLSVKEIADELNKSHFRTRNGLEWNRTRLQAFFYNQGVKLRKGVFRKPYEVQIEFPETQTTSTPQKTQIDEATDAIKLIQTVFHSSLPHKRQIKIVQAIIEST